MPVEGDFSLLKAVVLVIGLASVIALIAGCFISFKRKSIKATLIFAGTGFLSGLVTMGVSWLGYLQDKSVVQEAIKKAGNTIDAELAMTSIVGSADYVTLGLCLSILPLLLGIVLLVRGMFLLSAEGGHTVGRSSLVAVTILVALGTGLSLVALVDYLRFSDFFALLLVLS